MTAAAVVNERVRMEERGRTCDDDDGGGRGSFATGMRLRPRSVNPREDENETRRRRTHRRRGGGPYLP
jgi:hypothetical protein